MQNVHANLIKQISNNYFKFFMYSYNKLIVSNILIIKKKKQNIHRAMILNINNK